MSVALHADGVAMHGEGVAMHGEGVAIESDDVGSSGEVHDVGCSSDGSCFVGRWSDGSSPVGISSDGGIFHVGRQPEGSQTHGVDCSPEGVGIEWLHVAIDPEAVGPHCDGVG